MEKQTTQNRIVPDKLNHLYSYANSNPINYMDILGLDWVSDGNGSYVPSVPGKPLGDYLSDPNGNLFPGSGRQDMKCTLGPFGPLGDACFPQRCIKHDQCYAQNQCNASSWVPSILGGSKSCNQCNSGFFK